MFDFVQQITANFVLEEQLHHILVVKLNLKEDM